MVGVPALALWACGPSSRMYWPICMRRRRSMVKGPRASTRKRAVRLAMAVRNVMYRTTLSTDSSGRRA